MYRNGCASGGGAGATLARVRELGRSCPAPLRVSGADQHICLSSETPMQIDPFGRAPFAGASEFAEIRGLARDVLAELSRALPGSTGRAADHRCRRRRQLLSALLLRAPPLRSPMIQASNSSGEFVLLVAQSVVCCGSPLCAIRATYRWRRQSPLSQLSDRRTRSAAYSFSEMNRSISAGGGFSSSSATLKPTKWRNSSRRVRYVSGFARPCLVPVSTGRRMPM